MDQIQKNHNVHKPTYALIYIRVSTINQIGPDHLSLNVQEEQGKKYVQNHNYTLKGIYKDEGISGKSISIRPGFQKALMDLGTNNVLIVHSLSRLSRSLKDVLTIIETITKKNCELVSLTESWADTTTPTGRMMIKFVSLFNEFEREQTSKRVKSIMQDKKAKNQLVGRIPYGYKLGTDGKTLIKNEEQQPAIKEVLRMRNKEFMSFNKIAKTLQQRGVKRGQYAESNKWNHSAVIRIFNKHSSFDNVKRFKGKITYGYKINENTHEYTEDESQQRIINNIVDMKNTQNMTFKQISSCFRMMNILYIGNEQWTSKIVSTLYNEKIRNVEE